MRILIIEDNPMIQRGYQRLLNKMFARPDIWVADNADLAIGMLMQDDSARPIDLIISDYELADATTGVDVFEWIKLHRPDLLVRFIFISANEEVKALNHTRVLEKPATHSQIMEAILR